MIDDNPELYYYERKCEGTGTMHLLVVEDDPEMVTALQAGFEEIKYECSVARSIDEAFKHLDNTRFDLVLLDLELHGRDGLDVLRKIRGDENRVPVIIISGGRIDLGERVKGLDTGADDYLIKPFEFPELIARIRALLRRSHSGDSLKIQVKDLEIDIASRSVHRAGNPIELTQREFALLEYLARRAGQVVTRDMIAADVWKEASRVTPLDNVIDVHIFHLRQKIDQNFDEKLLQTVWGEGFKLVE